MGSDGTRKSRGVVCILEEPNQVREEVGCSDNDKTPRCSGSSDCSIAAGRSHRLCPRQQYKPSDAEPFADFDVAEPYTNRAQVPVTVGVRGRIRVRVQTGTPVLRPA